MPPSIFSPKIIAKLLSKTKPLGPPEVKHFQFLMILVADEKPEDVPAIIGAVMSTLGRHHANISVTPPLVVALLGVPFPESNSSEGRQELVEALLREKGKRIRIAHGQCDGAVGMLGGDGRWTYGAVIPGFTGILEKLLEADFGTAVEAF